MTLALSPVMAQSLYFNSKPGPPSHYPLSRRIVHFKTWFMKRILLKWTGITIIAAILFAFTFLRAGSIKGTISPTDAGVRAWAESATDTLRAPIINGSYEITDAKPGAYKVIIEAKPPYRNIAKDGIMVNDGQPTDVGEIRLEK
jgi:hypothetical protein